MHNILSTSALSRVFTTLASSNPQVVLDFPGRVHCVSGNLERTCVNKNDPQVVADAMSELFKPTKDSPILGLSIPSIKGNAPVVLRSKNLEELKEDPLTLLRGEISLVNNGGSIADLVVSVSIDPQNHKHAIYSFNLLNNETCTLDVLEEQGRTTVSISGGKEVVIDDACRTGESNVALNNNLNGLIRLKEDVLKQHQAAASN